jgi:hypothetical protein
MLSELNSIANVSDPLKFAYQSISYKPFLSLFNMTGAAEQHPELAEIGEFATNIQLSTSTKIYAISSSLRGGFGFGSSPTFGGR